MRLLVSTVLFHGTLIYCEAVVFCHIHRGCIVVIVCWSRRSHGHQRLNSNLTKQGMWPGQQPWVPPLWRGAKITATATVPDHATVIGTIPACAALGVTWPPSAQNYPTIPLRLNIYYKRLHDPGSSFWSNALNNIYAQHKSSAFYLCISISDVCNWGIMFKYSKWGQIQKYEHSAFYGLVSYEHQPENQTLNTSPLGVKCVRLAQPKREVDVLI